MFTYNVRARGYFGVNVISLAVLTDEHADWKPSQFKNRMGGFELLLKYPVCKIIDYKKQLMTLENSINPIKIFIAAHLETQASRKEPQKLNAKKWELTRSLYEKGL